RRPSRVRTPARRGSDRSVLAAAGVSSCMLLKDKTAVIYAAGGAIGAAVARAFAREGARVFLTGRDLAKLDADAAAGRARVGALDSGAVGAHLDPIGAVDISFTAVGPGPAPHRTALPELPANAFAAPIAFYARSNFIPATAAARRMSA